MAAPSTLRGLLALVHEYATEPAPADSDAAAARDLDYFDCILVMLGDDPEPVPLANTAPAGRST